MGTKQHKYTLLMLYPIYQTDSCETHTAYVTATSLKQAVHLAQKQAAEACGDEDIAADIRPLILLEGFHEDHLGKVNDVNS